MLAPPGNPVHCVQLWSCQIDAVSGAILQEGSWIPGWSCLMVTGDWRKPHLFDFPHFFFFFVHSFSCSVSLPSLGAICLFELRGELDS